MPASKKSPTLVDAYGEVKGVLENIVNLVVPEGLTDKESILAPRKPTGDVDESKLVNIHKEYIEPIKKSAAEFSKKIDKVTESLVNNPHGNTNYTKLENICALPIDILSNFVNLVGNIGSLLTNRTASHSTIAAEKSKIDSEISAKVNVIFNDIKKIIGLSLALIDAAITFSLFLLGKAGDGVAAATKAAIIGPKPKIRPHSAPVTRATTPTFPPATVFTPVSRDVSLPAFTPVTPEAQSAVLNKIANSPEIGNVNKFNAERVAKAYDAAAGISQANLGK